MIEIISKFIPEITSFITGATIGSLVTVKLYKKTASKGGTLVDQSYSQAGKDIVGKNKTTIKE